MDYTLEKIAGFLESLEETIIHKLIDRSQYKLNPPVYNENSSGFSGEPGSLFMLRLKYQESMDSVFGRFAIPEERPFTGGLPAPHRSVIFADSFLFIADYDSINLTPEILADYLGLVPRICAPGDDGQYGSSAEHDVYALQAISRRVHYGSFYVAERKYRDAPAQYRKLLEAGDLAAVEKLLTRPEVEERIVGRVAEKTAMIQKTVRSDIRYTLDPQPLKDFYRDVIIPLTRKGEVRYMLGRNRKD